MNNEYKIRTLRTTCSAIVMMMIGTCDGSRFRCSFPSCLVSEETEMDIRKYSLYSARGTPHSRDNFT